MENNLPKVSIIMLCYNHENYVEKALESLFNQNYPNLQIIIIEDHSSDSTKQKIESFLENNHSSHEIVKIFNPDNEGIVSNLNHGLEYVTGKYLHLFSSDDILFPDKISKQVKQFEKLNNSVGFIYCNHNVIDQSGSVISQSQFDINGYTINDYPCGRVPEMLYLSYQIIPLTIMYRTSAVKEVGGWDKNCYFEDYNMAVKLCKNYSIQGNSEILCSYRKLNDSVYSKTSSFNLINGIHHNAKYILNLNQLIDLGFYTSYLYFDKSKEVKEIKSKVAPELNKLHQIYTSK
jgi:glycosyltransferase involved in cell wall biosynthesis